VTAARAAAALAVVLAPALAPELAWACPGCISGAFGDRSYSWPYIGLILAPFGVGVAIGSVLAWRYRALRRSPPASEPSLDKETT
jgi:MFS family permease